MRYLVVAPLLALICPLMAEEESSFGATLDVAWTWLMFRGTAIALTIIIGFMVWFVVKRLLTRLFERTRMVPAFAGFVQRGLRWLMVLIIGLAVIQQIGVELGMLWGLISAGIAMVAIGFVAVWSMLSNTTAAFILLMSRPFRIGDTIEITEATGGAALKGILTDISLVYTTIEEIGENGSKAAVRIPNNVLLQKTIRVVPVAGGIDLGTHLSDAIMGPPPIDPALNDIVNDSSSS